MMWELRGERGQKVKGDIHCGTVSFHSMAPMGARLLHPLDPHSICTALFR